jgi:hypothetical protein
VQEFNLVLWNSLTIHRRQRKKERKKERKQKDLEKGLGKQIPSLLMLRPCMVRKMKERPGPRLHITARRFSFS